MDAVSDSIIELAFQNQHLPPVLNIVHPRPTEWNTIIKLVNDALVLQKKIHTPLPLVSFQEWFSNLEGRTQSPDQAVEIKIVCPFFFFLSFFCFSTVILTAVCSACT